MGHAVPNICQLHDSIFAIVGPEGATNFGIIKGDDGWALLIDADIRRIDEIETALKETGSSGVRYLFNTHENYDHSSANDYFAHKGVTVIASDGCWEALEEDGEAKFVEMSGREPELKKRFPQLAMGMPQLTFGHDTTVHLPGFKIQLRYSAYNGKSHSRGDAVAIVDKPRILFAGDLLYTEVHPVAVYGNIPNWIQGIDILLREDFPCVVPGHGPVSQGSAACREAFSTFREYLKDFHSRLGEMKSGSKSAAEIESYMKSGPYAGLGKTWMVKRNIEFFQKRRKLRARESRHEDDGS